MKIHATSMLLALTAGDVVDGFTTPTSTSAVFVHPVGKARKVPTHLNTQHTPEEQETADEEIEKLKSMAQRLRAEAAALEAERAEELAEAAESAFRKFDVNKDGEISLEELKEGLEKVLKTELPESRVKQLMEDFDASGDGKLQLDEFVGIEKFRNKLEALAREEKLQALEAKKAAQKEEEMAKMAEAARDLLNDREPTTRDKLVSVLPYLFPLLDSLQFGRFLIAENQDNPFVVILALLYGLYRSVPFSGFIAFLALNVLSSNPGINRLVRFNMQQAIFIDIALFFPGLLAAAYSLIASGAGFQVPASLTELGSDIIFGSLLLTIAYASVSSLFGVAPNKVPLISKAVEDRMPTVDMFDANGTFIGRKEDSDEDKKD